MKTQSQTIPIPIVTSGANTTPVIEVGGAFGGVTVQFVGIAGSGTYKIQFSCDEGTTWVDITHAFADMSTGTALSADVAADAVLQCTKILPGLLRILCTHVGTGTPKASINYQDSRAV